MLTVLTQSLALQTFPLTELVVVLVLHLAVHLLLIQLDQSVFIQEEPSHLEHQSSEKGPSQHFEQDLEGYSCALANKPQISQQLLLLHKDADLGVLNAIRCLWKLARAN